MVRVLYALIPIILASIYFFGWRCLLILVIVNAVGFITEYLFVRNYKEPVSSAVFVTSCLFTLSLPPTIPIWMAVVGIVFAIVFGKMVFGGFGKNIFNPALSGRVFLYVSFGLAMTANWVNPIGGGLGGFAKFQSDAITEATPLALMKAGQTQPLAPLLLGNISGSIGETSAILIILGGIYIIWKKAANYRIVLGCLAGFFFFQTLLWLFHVKNAADPISAFLAGGFCIGIFFYATDPISAAQTDEGKWIYGIFIGIISVVIRVLAAWPEGVMFAILLGNMFSPILDYHIREAKMKRKKAVA